MLAHVYEQHRVTYPCYVQPKLNGIRALYQNGAFQSRDELPFPKGLLDHLAKPLLSAFGPEVILDGELYRHGWPLQRINGAVTPVRQQPTEDTLQVEYHIFDIANNNQTFAERFHQRQMPLWDRWPVHRVQTIHCGTEQLANAFYSKCVNAGYEGMMYRLGDCPYTMPKQPGGSGRTKFLSDQSNRCWHLLKRKDWQDDEFLCVEVKEGEGRLQGTLGALHCQVVPGRHVYFDVGSGLTDAERETYWKTPPIGRQIKVKYLVLSSDGIPLNPTILAVL